MRISPLRPTVELWGYGRNDSVSAFVAVEFGVH